MFNDSQELVLLKNKIDRLENTFPKTADGLIISLSQNLYLLNVGLCGVIGIELNEDCHPDELSNGNRFKITVRDCDGYEHTEREECFYSSDPNSL